MQATRHHPAPVLEQARQARDAGLRSVSPVRAEPAMSSIERWTERFCERLVAWGEAANHHRMGSWTRR